eukprot:CAMPEP_0201544854 /NCGR_PEP_ID=MMETSP0173_2-20130828/1474_1 /ASSEMBLY_ACC=CAM_ASM_000268 /TAXON_ID=218659 /ORGANISM="Vexillifera sp., Strain DIVA3 564/2" /LENGTH=43 /DNA_ID= /DNA_START= /DNA_END= /DNA_ORIENTATION=
MPRRKGTMVETAAEGAAFLKKNTPKKKRSKKRNYSGYSTFIYR